MCRRSDYSNINRTRLELIDKGFLTIKDIQRFCMCGYPKAKGIYDEIITEIKKEKKKISPLGIRSTRLLAYLEISEADIRNYVLDEINSF